MKTIRGKKFKITTWKSQNNLKKYFIYIQHINTHKNRNDNT